MPVIYTTAQKKERIEYLEAQITIARHEGNKKELRRLWNLLHHQKWKWKDDLE